MIPHPYSNTSLIPLKQSQGYRLIQETHNRVTMTRNYDIQNQAIEFVKPTLKCFPEVLFMIKSKTGGVINGSVLCIIQKSSSKNICYGHICATKDCAGVICGEDKKCSSGQCVDISTHCDSDNPCIDDTEECKNNTCVRNPKYCDIDTPCEDDTNKCFKNLCVDKDFCVTDDDCKDNKTGKICIESRCGEKKKGFFEKYWWIFVITAGVVIAASVIFILLRRRKSM